MLKINKLLAIAVASTTIVACSPYTQNQDTGAVAGAVAGGLLGSTVGGGNGRLVAVGLGALGGSMLGSSVGRSMDQENADRGYQNPYRRAPGYSHSSGYDY